MKKFDIAIKIFFLIIIIFPYSMIQAQLNPLINEILASNINYMADNYGDYDDIIELYNPTDGNINLAGYYLSDDYDNLKKWVFPQNDSLFILAPNEYLVMWADDEIFQGINHLPFSLNKNGEAVILTHPNGNEIIDQINFGYQRANISFGINDQSGEWEYYINPTIGYENEDGFDGILNPPSINPSGGYSSNPTIISLTDNNLNSDVYYNFDSQIPVEDDYLYDQAIIINNSTVLNSKSFKNSFISSNTNSQLYLINPEKSLSLPIFAILTDPKNLWSDSLGIYTNYLKEGAKWERPCINQFFSNDTQFFTLPSGVRIQGNSSRVRQKKSFRLFYKSAYDNSYLNYPLFGEESPISFKNIVLRSGYDDDIQMETGTLIKDPLVTCIWEELGMLASRSIFSNLYINEQYWGIYNIRESVNEHFISDHTGFSDFDLIRYIKYDYDLKFGDIIDWNSFLSFIRNSDFSLIENYEEAAKLIDLDNLINLQALIICTSYWSWGWGVSAYKEKNSDDRWKWTIWDMDRAFTLVNWNGFTDLNDTTGLEQPNIIPYQLLKNDQFKYNYINRISDFYNTLFKPENLIEKIDSIKNIIKNDIHHESSRWGSDTTIWSENIDLIKEFAINRPNKVKEQLTDYFSLGEQAEVIIENVIGGQIRLNSISIKNFPWNGKYFKNIPIEIEAIPNPGYVFKEWESEQINDNPRKMTLESDINYIDAIFVPEDINHELKIVTPFANVNDKHHPLVFKYHIKNNLRMNNEPFYGNLYVNNSKIDSAVIIKKGVGSYLLDTEDLSELINIKIELNNEISDDISLPINTTSMPIDTISGTLPEGIHIWEANSVKYIIEDLIIEGDLTIHYGSQIYINQHKNITVNGSLNIIGEERNPVIFKAENLSSPWGGIEFYNSSSKIDNCFFINGGGDPGKGWKHTNTQPILFAKENSNLIVENSYILYCPGKAFGSTTSEVYIDSTIVSHVSMGGEFIRTYLNFNHSYVLNIPNDDNVYVDADNDGLYVNHRHPTINKPSKIKNSFFITGKDDAIDHAGSRIDIENCWIEGWLNQGIAASTQDTIRINNTISKNNQTGFEAGYGNPIVIIDHSLAVNNVDGFRLGDNYDMPNEGKMIITNSIAYGNTNNIKNYTNQLEGPLPNGIDISFSIVNDYSYDQINNNLSGIPTFNDSTFRLKYNSIGAGMGINGKNIGLIDSNVFKYGPLIINEVMYNASENFDTKDWVELYNPSDDSLDVSSWSIKDDDDSHIYNFPESLIIPSKGFLVVSKNIEAFQTFHNHDPQIIGDIPFGFGRGDQIRIYSSIMELVDSLEYDIHMPWPTSPNDYGHALELTNLEDNSSPQSWSASTNIIGTPGCDNKYSMCPEILKEKLILPKMVDLSQNFPNPFNFKTCIIYTIYQDSHVTLVIHDLIGRKIKTIINMFEKAGEKRVFWDSTNDNNEIVPSGLYFYTIKLNNSIQTKKMMLVK